MFSLHEQKAKLANVNIRAELHGEDTKIAVDMKIEIKVGNDILSEFHPDLKSSFYKKAEAGQADLIDEPGRLTKLKFDELSPLKWSWSGVGYETVINYGVSGKDDITMELTDISQFVFEMMEGGTVGLCFRVSAHPTPEEIGRLSELVQREITLTLVEPESDQ